jgi:two-component system, LytTR family, response regulator
MSVNAKTELKRETANYLNVKADRKIYKVDISKIQYIESLKDYVKIVCSDESIVTHDSLSNLEAFLDEYGFIRIHRSFLVAIAKIRSFDAESVFLEKNELPISRSYKKSVLAILAEKYSSVKYQKQTTVYFQKHHANQYFHLQQH